MNTIAEQRARLEELLAPTPEHELLAMERKTLLSAIDEVEARVSDDDTGDFEAIVSTWEVDRADERVERGAFAETLGRWRRSGKQMPLLWSHDTKTPSMVIGALDPAEMIETDEGLRAKGRIDLQSNTGREVHRLLKRGSPLGWSIGYRLLPEDAVKRGALRVIRKITELLEISVTPTPMNRGTRTLAVKGVDVPQPEPEPPPSAEELRAKWLEHGIATSEDDRVRVESCARMLALLTGGLGTKAAERRVPTHLEIERRLIREGYIGPGN